MKVRKGTSMKRAIAIAAIAIAVAACSSAAPATEQPATTKPDPTPRIIVITPEPVTPEPVTPEPVVETPEPVVEEEVAEEATSEIVPFGTWATVGDWKIRFAKKTNFNAWKAVKRANMFNDPPEAGNRDVLAWVEYQYLGSGREAFDPMFVLRAIGNSGVEYSQFEDPTCGVLPDPDITMRDPTLRKGGKAKGWVCWQVAKEDVGSLLAFTAFFDDFDGERIVGFRLK